MKVYFNFSARGIPEFTNECLLIKKTLESLGHTLTFSPPNYPTVAQKIYSSSQIDLHRIYTEAMRKIGESDIVILEVSIHSITQGFIISKALYDEKPVIALHLPSKAPVFALGIKNEKLLVLEYTPETLKDVLKSGIAYTKEQTKVRFNLFISNEMNKFLHWLANKSDETKSNLVRGMISDAMEEHSEEYRTPT